MPLQHCPTANISQHSFNTVIGDTLFSEASGVYTPHSLQEVALTFIPTVGIEEIANGVVHPGTNKTMTKYAKIIEVPKLQEFWLETYVKGTRPIGKALGEH